MTSVPPSRIPPAGSRPCAANAAPAVAVVRAAPRDRAAPLEVARVEREREGRRRVVSCAAEKHVTPIASSATGVVSGAGLGASPQRQRDDGAASASASPPAS